MSFIVWLLYKQKVLFSFHHSDLIETQYGAIMGFVAGLVAMVLATIFGTPKPVSDLKGLVFGLQEKGVRTTPRSGGTGPRLSLRSSRSSWS